MTTNNYVKKINCIEFRLICSINTFLLFTQKKKLSVEFLPVNLIYFS